MSLIAIENNKSSSNKIRVKFKLTEEEVQLFARFYALGKPLSREEKQKALKLSINIHNQDLWLQCDCVAGEKKPVFRFNRSPKGNLYIHHITSRGEHAHYCVFKERSYKKRDKGCDDYTVKPNIKKSSPLNIMSQRAHGIVSKKSPSGRVESPKSVGKRRSSLCNVLYRLIDDAGINVIGQKKGSPFSALDKAVSKTSLLPNKSLKDYFHTNPNHLIRESIALREDTTAWPKNIPKHCLFLVKVDSIQDNTLNVIYPNGEIKPICINNRIFYWSGRFSSRTSPFMALISITDSVLKPNFYEPFNAFVVPCYSEGTYIPVDSFYEREVLRKLYGLKFQLENKDICIEIVKPLFDITVFENTEDEAFVLPDFIIKTPNKRIVIEVNGSHEPEYLERKLRVHELMKEIGPVLSIDAYGAEIKKSLPQAIAKLINQIKEIIVC